MPDLLDTFKDLFNMVSPSDDKPTCPFCSTDKVAVEPAFGAYHVRCLGCGAMGPTGGTPTEAVERFKVRG